MIFKKFSLTVLILCCVFCEQINGSQYVWQQTQTLRSYIQERMQKASFVSRVARCFNSGLDFCKKYPGTTGLMAANLGIFAAQKYYQYKAQAPILEMKFELSNSAVKQGEWWRLFTSMFLHGDSLHVAVNTFSLFNMRILEKIAGLKKFLSVYVASGVLANIASYGLGKLEERSLGASGAVFGLSGAYYGFAIKRKWITYNELAGSVASSLWQNIMLSRLLVGATDHVAHVGGLVSGYALGLAFSD